MEKTNKMSSNKKFAIFIFVVVVILAAGKAATSFNEENHQRMAMEQCGSQEQIAHVDSKGFSCVE
ncbi:hypothetical protein [Simiduia aestuariiviva]|uniref:Uncharacterized protein n=1 Tax=Simiduia aestuariiviva TaxID=1510459 RepID=A0A839UPP7_9GAMM|nr:hypothetical protein [Simiduia aestuariiviva]MBB3170194.1 hypothetical protein [Simiduia aestuariiviva]